MPKYKQAAMAIAFLTIIFSAGAFAGLSGVDASDEDGKSQYQQEAILQAFEDNDYQTWKRLVAKNKVVKNIIDESKFQEFVFARSAARSGNYEEAILVSEKIENELKQKMSLLYLS